MSKRIDKEEQRLVCMMTDANAKLHSELARMMRAVNRVQRARKALTRVGWRLTKRRAELAAERSGLTPNGKDGAK